MANRISLPLDGCVKLVERLVEDFSKWSESDTADIPNKRLYKIAAKEEPNGVTRSARKAALKAIKNNDLSLKKFAFDTRRVDQELQGNPRKNLQYYHRSQQYIDAEVHKRMSAFSNLIPALDSIQDKYGDQPEYFAKLILAFHANSPPEVRSALKQQADLIEPLSDRELEVLSLLIEGKSNRLIASELFVSVNTVKTHLKNVYDKLGVNGRAQAVARASDLNLLK